MNNKDFLEDLEFENPVEIRTLEEEKKPKKGIVFILIILLLSGLNIFFGYKYFTAEKQIKSLKNKIATLQQQIEEKDNTLKLINEKLGKFKKMFSNTDKNKKQLLSSITKLENEIEKYKKTIKSLKNEKKKLSRRLKQSEESNKKLQSELKKAKSLISDKENLLKQKDNKIAELQLKNKNLEKTLKDLRTTFSMESDATKKIVSEMLSYRKENEKLKTEINKLKTEIDTLNKEIKKLKTVEEGDLVPSSDKLTLAKPLVNPPVTVKAKGLFSKVKGYAVVNALIDEYGNVVNAYFVYSDVPEDKIDRGILINKVLTTVKKWKFSPPTYGGSITVKTWQPVIVPIESE